VQAIDKLRIGKYLGVISANDMTAVEAAVRQVYGLCVDEPVVCDGVGQAVGRHRVPWSQAHG
jgi:hypothetical protein